VAAGLCLVAALVAGFTIGRTDPKQVKPATAV
jgi:hypothetical protein